jgi:ferredoxin/flavodoxin
MKTVLYYFSGTGNSLKIAKDLAEHLEHVDMRPISLVNGSADIVVEDAIVGFVFPVYFLDVPDIVHQFVQKLSFMQKPYIFAVVSCGGYAGNTLHDLNRLLRQKAHQLNAGFVITMPDNSLVYVTTPEEHQKCFQAEQERIPQIADQVKQKSAVAFEQPKIVKNRIMKSVMIAAMKWYFRYHKKRCDQQKCTRCQVCVRICPVENIRFAGGIPSWGNTCADCYACIHWCPHKAVQFGKLHVSKNPQYRHPEICLDDMVVR